jgi:hypothetical protein
MERSIAPTTEIRDSQSCKGDACLSGIARLFILILIRICFLPPVCPSGNTATFWFVPCRFELETVFFAERITTMPSLRHSFEFAFSAVLLFAAAAWAEEAKIFVRADEPGHRISRYLTGACIEDVNHEIYGGIYSQMVFGESFQEPSADNAPEISRMWRIVERGGATGACRIEKEKPFVGKQSQRITFSGGQGEFGVENQGLNRWGMHFVQGKPYEGVLWARAEKPVDIFVSIESKDGQEVAVQKQLSVKEGDWRRLAFTLEPEKAVPAGRFTVALHALGSVVLGYAFLQPGEWGCFKGLPDRRDVAEGLLDQGVTVLRYGGSMINHSEYRWKKMIGPRDKRQPHANTWYPYASNGWGILDFMDFCEAAGFLYIPDFNMDEKPGDMADFIEYAKGQPEGVWGRKRVEDGHPRPYDLRYVQLGNEERVDEKYYEKFEPLAEAIWAKDPKIILVVGDFCYMEEFDDPSRVRGSAAGLKTLEAQQKILQLAKRHDREVWFDVHVGTDGPLPDSSFDGFFSFRNALDKIADGAKHQVVTFEFNAGNHSQRRALANAIGIQRIQRDGRIPIATSANCLQPDGQNDNDWDQGLLFLNPEKVWLQPPGYVTRMISRNYQPLSAPAEVAGGKDLDVSAARSEDGKVLVLQVVNVGDRPQFATVEFEGFAPTKKSAAVEELSGPLDAANTTEAPQRIVPKTEDWEHGFAKKQVNRTFPPLSFTVIRFE